MPDRRRSTILRNDQRRRPQAAQSGRVVGGGGDVGAALAGAANNIGNANAARTNQNTRFANQDRLEAERLAKQQKALADASAVSSLVADAQIELDASSNEVLDKSDGTGVGLEQRLTEAFEVGSSAALDRAENDEQAVAVQRSMDKLRVKYLTQARQLQSEQAASHHVGRLNDSINKSSSSLVSRPQDLDLELELLTDSVVRLQGTGIDPAKLKEFEQKSRNQLTVGAVEGIILKDPAAASARLTAGEFDDDINGSQKVTLINRANARYKAQNVVGATELKSLASDAIGMLYDGMPVQDSGQLLEALKGTPKGDELARAVRAQPALSEFRSLPLIQMREQSRVLNEQAAAGNLPVKTIDFYRAQQSLMSKMESEYKKAPLASFAKYQMQEPLPPMADASARESWAAAATASSGIDTPPLTKEEMSTLSNQIKAQVNSGQVAQALQPFAEYSDRSRKLIGSRLVGDDASMGIAVAMSGERPEISESILRGMKASKQAPVKRADISNAITDAHREIYAGSATAMDQTMQAASNVYADIMSREGKLPAEIFDREVFTRALNMVEGGAPIEFNGAPILTPSPLVTSERELKLVVDSLSDQDIIKYGTAYNNSTGEHIPITELPFAGGAGGFEMESVGSEQLRDIKLKQAKQGVYYVELSTGFLMGADNQPYVIDLSKYIKENGVPQGPGLRERAAKTLLGL